MKFLLNTIGRFLQIPGEIVIGIIWFVYLLFHPRQTLGMSQKEAEMSVKKLYAFVIATSILIWAMGIAWIIRK